MAKGARSAFRILIVDDDDIIRESLSLVLKRGIPGSQIQTAASGPEAIESLADLPPHVAISDYNMPGMDGVEVLKRVKALVPDVATILITGHADVQLGVRAVNEARVDGFFTKPLNPVEVLETLQQLLIDRVRRMHKRERFEETLHQIQQTLVDQESAFKDLRRIQK